MNQKYIEPPIGLFENILKRIHREGRILELKRSILPFAALSLIIFSVSGAAFYEKTQNNTRNGSNVLSITQDVFNNKQNLANAYDFAMANNAPANNYSAQYPYNRSKAVFYTASQSTK